ncbi:TRAP transporter small permease [Pseudovibrio sp. Tun.PSC04-5.I4]|uniref:TRAP transporter small permease n=1 Tax=Pseudovibrio sp. Tun.PSC04-5.I4 TaxID=1798213 RepID=UPI0008903C57|nr:TRAP transporter small permease [Pseudovibrio sp. Tun.PSC04-5.I4]SDR48752.1 TRAP-type C4-dicarboxylate transport system, small permease component [Pseudovibrio sp. Tun.PSC04-5.I4]
MNLLHKLDRMLSNLFLLLGMVLLVVLFALTSLNVILRFFPIFSIGWFDEIVEVSFAWMVFTVAAYLWRDRAHPFIDFLLESLKGRRSQYVLLIFIESMNIFFLVAFTYYSFSLMMRASAWSPIFQIPKSFFYMSMPIAGAYMTIVSLFFWAGHLRNLCSSNPTPFTYSSCQK